MLRGDCVFRSALGIAALAFLSLGPARAEFPPDGAVADPNNGAIASGIYPLPTRDGQGLKYVFYFDCGIGMWIGVAVSGSDSGQTQRLNATGRGREFPSGPPPGSERDPADLNHAFNLHTGETFVLRDGDWSDTKTGALIKSPKLCSAASHAPSRPTAKEPAATGAVAGENPLFPDAYRPPLGDPPASAPQKPDKLPSRSVYIPSANGGSNPLNPAQGPIRISIPRPDGHIDVLH
jgi:hypothetical protein